ncbi:cell wall-associated NlpC family hydrolase [Kibdelosporangium banguiense]|uniref:Cell wall-associated NlpC family hydrolase n=1 Tax=Kibdelosporangium banguiense TaxID=1365924 RepID=A0ABS4U384_9PSEU|nr:NlpC/P60 family protein [Kibdelosporangium banguiense]MBP2331127.1 cell wall-associated NlpC family hydrolase [Kibdelosporangium banguiense]
MENEGDTRDVASQRLKRGMRGALTASAVIAMVSTSPAPAIAQPPAQNSESDALKKYRELSEEAEKVNEDFLKATDDKNAKQAELDKATAELAEAGKSKDAAQAKENEFRGQVEDLSSASFRGARFNKLSALLTGTSAQDFLDRSTALNVLATDNNKALTELHKAVTTAADSATKAADAQRRATEARDAAAKLSADIEARKKDLASQIKQVESAARTLSAADKAKLNPPADNGVYFGPPGAAGTAMQAALSMRGQPYVWGGAAPGGFDCSGLTSWAYKQANVVLPRSSRAQYGVGKPVSKDALIPGDLLFYGSSASSIHHVAMYIGNGMIVHASTSGTPVMSVPMEKGGKDFFAAKRVVG